MTKQAQEEMKRRITGSSHKLLPFDILLFVSNSMSVFVTLHRRGRSKNMIIRMCTRLHVPVVHAKKERVRVFIPTWVFVCFVCISAQDPVVLQLNFDVCTCVFTLAHVC